VSEREDILAYIDSLEIAEGNSFIANRTEIERSLQDLNPIKYGMIIRILILLGGFLSGCFFLMFIFSLGLDKSPTGMLLFGLFSIYGSIWLYTRSHQLIFESICLSFFITGFLLVGIAFGNYHLDHTLACLLYCALSVIALALTKNYLMVIASVLNIFGSLLTCIILNKWNILFHAYNPVLIILITCFSLQESYFVTRFRKSNENYNPIRLGLIISYLIGMIAIVGVKIFPAGNDLIWISSILNGLLLFYLLGKILSILGVIRNSTKLIIYLITFLLMVSLTWAPAISGSILIFLICFMVNERVGFIAGILACIYFISQYYYDLEYTLLVKSEILVSIGVLFFLFYFITHKTLAADEEV
jgi:hypothetical protein